MKKDQSRDDLQTSQQGSGSAENMGRNREDQKSKNTTLGSSEKKDIAHDISLDEKDVADLSDLGQLSGRDDYSGNYNDGMSDANTNEGTDR